jgi:hypothetical protein
MQWWMRPWLIGVMCAGCVGVVAACGNASETKAAGSGSELKSEAEGWVSLFNGKDLTGWEVMGGNKNAFYVKDGVIECNGGGGHWLRYSERQFEDFVFSLEYKVSQGTNSGIFFRAAIEGNPAYSGMEIQILDDHGQDPRVNTTGAIYGSITPMLNQSKPAGEWNHVEITCKGESVVIFMNGIKIVDIMMDQHESLKNRLRKGYVGMQDHGNYIWFRNLKIKPL